MMSAGDARLMVLGRARNIDRTTRRGNRTGAGTGRLRLTVRVTAPALHPMTR
jgi:hypothetical protein